MHYLGVPAAVAYEAMGFASGLEGVHAWVRKPGGALVGPFEMTEGLLFAAGLYFFEFETTDDDPEGRYFFLMYSPQESRRASVAISFVRRPSEFLHITSEEPMQTEVLLAEDATLELQEEPLLTTELQPVDEYDTVELIDVPAVDIEEVEPPPEVVVTELQKPIIIEEQ